MPEKQEITELKKYSEQTNSEPIIAVKFNNEEWKFFKPEEIKETEKNFVITREDLPKIGKVFIELIK